MKDINLKELQDIQIPEGLEERLSAKIDLWEQEELMANAPVRKPVIALRWWHYASVAACVAMIAGAIVLFNNNEKEAVVAKTKTEKQDNKLIATNIPDNTTTEETTKPDSKAIAPQKPSATQSTPTEQPADDEDMSYFKSAEDILAGQIAGFDQQYYQEQLNKEAERDLADTPADNEDMSYFKSAEDILAGQIAGFDQKYYQEQLNKEAERDLEDMYSELEAAFNLCEQKQIDMLRAIHAAFNP